MHTRIAAYSLIAAALLAVTGAPALAQPRGGRGMGMPNYNKATEVTVTGTIEEVQSMQAHMPGMGMGVHLTLKTDSGTFDVHVGPANWLKTNTVEFVKGDRIEVVGSSVDFNGQQALIAREITKGDRKITLRDANGIPVWSGRGRRSQS